MSEANKYIRVLGKCDINTLFWCKRHQHEFITCVDKMYEMFTAYKDALDFYLTPGTEPMKEYEEPHWGAKADHARSLLKAFMEG